MIGFRKRESPLLRGGKLGQPGGVSLIFEGRPAEDKGGLRPTEVSDPGGWGTGLGGCLKESFPGETAAQRWGGRLRSLPILGGL